MKLLWSVLLLAAASSGVLFAQAPAAKTSTIADKTNGTTRLPGYFPLYWDAKAGKLWLEIDKWDTEFLYLESLPAGLGSNDVGLDRGQSGHNRVVKFSRIGPKVLLTQTNYDYRANTSEAAERRAAADSFAQSVLYGFTVDAETGDHVLVDASSFFLRDVHDVTGTLTRAKQGTFKLDPTRSAFYLDRTRNFPQNTEVEVTLTFGSDNPGPLVRSVTPSADSVTVREHHSFVQLPGPGFRLRPFEPNSGFFGTSFFDFATPIDQPIRKQYLVRHRLEEKDPTAALSDPVKPIVYYLDPGAPEPIRSALLEGARWWNRAFEAAGYRNAFRVELLPADADPMDVRYNLIQWVHRSTRGWSYGAAITDPRTGEIIKGQVTLGSLRVRQDFMIAEGWLAPYLDGKSIPPAMQQMAVARLRQLAAHEVGHTLGLSHNFAASTHNRASVMDYPHPLIKENAAGEIDLTDAYATGIGEWDKVAIEYGYREFPAGADEAPALRKILTLAHARGLTFITDGDSRPPGGAHPYSHLWDSGGNPIDELNRMMALRAKALARFGEHNIRNGDPWSNLEDVLVPLYLSHRYQVEAASKVVGGVNYTYAVRGDGQLVTQPISDVEQQRALTALLATIKPEALTLPEKLIALIPPRAFEYPRTREDFPQRTGVTFDPVSAAESAADLTVSFLLNSERASRLVDNDARHTLGLFKVVQQLIAATWAQPTPEGLTGEVKNRVDYVVLARLMMLATDDRTSPQARAVAHTALANGIAQLNSDNGPRASYMRHLIELYLRDPKSAPVPKLVEAPPGQPIGCDWETP